MDFKFEPAARMECSIDHINHQRQKAEDYISSLVHVNNLPIQSLAKMAAKYPGAGDIIFGSAIDKETKGLKACVEMDKPLTPQELQALLNVTFVKTYEENNDPSMTVFESREGAAKTDFFSLYAERFPDSVIESLNAIELDAIGCRSSVRVQEKPEQRYYDMHNDNDNLVLLMLQKALPGVQGPVPEKIFSILDNQKRTPNGHIPRYMSSGKGTIGDSIQPVNPGDVLAHAKFQHPKSYQAYVIGSLHAEAQNIQQFYNGSHSSYSIFQAMDDIKNLSQKENLPSDVIQALTIAHKDITAADPHTTAVYKKRNAAFRAKPEGELFNKILNPIL